MHDHINRFIVCDYILGNIDRHEGNFGAVRNSETRRFSGMALLFDTGLSLLCHRGDESQNTEEILANPVRSPQQQQLAMVDDFSRFDPSALAGFESEVAETLARCRSRYMDEQRIAYLVDFVGAGIETVAEAASLAPLSSLTDMRERAERIREIRTARLAARGQKPVFVV